MAKRISNRNTKAEIIAAYKEVLKEKSSLEAQVKATPPSTNGKSAQTGTLVLENPKTVMEISKGKSEQQQVQDTIAQLSQIKQGFGSFVSQLSEKLTREAAQLAEVREQTQAQRQRLLELHELEDIDDDTLDNLVGEYETNSKQFVEEFESQRETLEQALEERKQAWQKERRDRINTIEEQRRDYQKACERDESEYRYARKLQRETDAETYRQEQEERYRQLDEARQAQEKAWEEREKALAEREKEYFDLKAKVEAFPGEKEAQIKRGKEIGRNIALAQTKAQAELRQQEIDGQTQRYELQVQGLETTIGDRETRIAKLTQQLDATLKQVQELAVKAIEGNANAQSLQAVKDIALEQAKNTQRGK